MSAFYAAPNKGYGALRRLRKFWLGMVSVLLLLPGLVRAEPVTIVALGDSLVHGYGLTPQTGFVPQMQKWLDEQGLDVALINAGVSGDTTTGGLARLDWALTPDADALIVALGGNDVLRAIEPAVARANLDAILTAAEARALPVLLVGINVPPNYGPEYQEEFSAIYPELAEAHGTLYYPDFLQVLTSRADWAATLDEYFQRDGLHPNGKGVKLIVEDMGPLVAELAGQADG